MGAHIRVVGGLVRVASGRGRVPGGGKLGAAWWTWCLCAPTAGQTCGMAASYASLAQRASFCAAGLHGRRRAASAEWARVRGKQNRRPQLQIDEQQGAPGMSLGRPSSSTNSGLRVAHQAFIPTPLARPAHRAWPWDAWQPRSHTPRLAPAPRQRPSPSNPGHDSPETCP